MKSDKKFKEKLHLQKLGKIWQTDRDTDRAKSKAFFDCIYET